MEKLLILGAGGYGQVVAELAAETGRFGEIAFLDDHAEQGRVLGCCADYRAFAGEYAVMYPAFGDNQLRSHWLAQLKAAGIAVLKLVHPTAYVSPSARLGSGTMVLPQAVVNARTEVGGGCIVNCGALIDHDCRIGAGVHIGLGAIVKAHCSVAAGTKVEAGSVILRESIPSAGLPGK